MIIELLKSLRILIALGALVSGLSSFAQQSSASIDNPVSDASALSSLASSVNAMGGSAAWNGIQDATASGTCSPGPSASGGSQSTTTFLWITTATQFRYEAGQQGEAGIMLSGQGAPSLIGPSSTQSLPTEMVTLWHPYHLPGEVLNQLVNDRSFYVSAPDNETVQGRSAIHVQVIHYIAGMVELGSKQDWWLDASTFLPIQVTYGVPGQRVHAYLPTTYYFSEWTTESGGIKVPQQISLGLAQNLILRTCTITTLEFNTNPASSLFDAR